MQKTDSQSDNGIAISPTWSNVTLGEICLPVRGINFPSGEAVFQQLPGTVACLTTSGVQAEVKWGARCFIPAERVKHDEQYLQVGDILVSTANSKALVGKSCLVRNLPYTCTFGAFVTVLRPRPSILPAMLAFVLRSEDFLRFCFDRSSNTTNISNLRVSDMLNFAFALPPLEEQRRIARIVAGQMAEVERARVAAEAQLAGAEEILSAYLRQTFTGVWWDQWTSSRLGDVIDLRKEVIHPYNGPTGMAVFVGLEHIERDSGRRIGSLDLDLAMLTGRKPQFFTGDIVYGYLRPYLNKVWIAEFDGVCSVDQYVYSVHQNKADTNFIAWFMRSPIYLERAPINTAPGQLPRIRTQEVASVMVNLPPIDEQRRITRIITEQISEIENMRAAIEAQLAAINELPSAFLKEAFSGKL